MSAKTVLVLIVLAAAGFGIYQFAAGPAGLEHLLTVPAGCYDPGYRDVQAIAPPEEMQLATEPGRITVVAFVSESCPACNQIYQYARMLTDRRTDVAVRFIDMGVNWRARDYEALCGVDIHSIPHVLIYDGDGGLVACDDGRDKDGLNLFCNWLNAELNRAQEDTYASSR
mgnify:CR=1 FL=1